VPEPAEPYRNPYTPYPGGGMPSAGTTPAEGKADLWAFFWLTLVNTAIISTAGIVTWWFVR